MTKTASLAVACALTFAFAAAATAGSSTRSQRFTLYTANLRGHDLPVVVQATGAINAVGSETQTDKDTKQGQVNYVTLHFSDGTLQLLAPERFSWQPNLASCSASAGGGGSWKITGGTGAYRGIVGHGAFSSRGVLLGARDSHGRCLGEKAQPIVNYVTVTLTGSITR